MKIIFEDKFLILSIIDNIIKLTWKKETVNLNDNLFKEEALKYLEIFKKSDIKSVIVDMRDFWFSLTQEVIDWRNKNIIKSYNEIWVKKFAFISNKPTVKQDNPENTFITKDFYSEEEALKWINT